MEIEVIYERFLKKNGSGRGYGKVKLNDNDILVLAKSKVLLDTGDSFLTGGFKITKIKEKS